VFVLQLKVDKLKLIELCGTSESEFSSVSGCMYSECLVCDHFIGFLIVDGFIDFKRGVNGLL